MLNRLQKLDWGLVIALLLPLIAALLTWGDGIAAGADVAVHVHRIHAMTESLQTGNFYPRWISYLHLGYGYPIFNYYAPGYIYLTALFELIGLPIAIAYNLVQTLFWSVGSVGMYRLARRFLPVQAAILAAALWVLAPSRLFEVWYQGSLAQIVAAAFIPYLILGVVDASREPKLRKILGIAFPYAALILSHTPMLYISTLYAAPLAFLLPIAYAKKDYRGIFRRWWLIGWAFVLGVGLAAIFLMPTLLELSYVNIAAGLDETVNYLREQYIPLNEIFSVPTLLDKTDLFLDLPRSLGMIGGIFSLFGLLALIRRKQYALAIMSLLGLGFTVFMLLDSSFPVWLAIPSFANLRFPARLLRIGAVIIALMGGASLLLLPKRWQFWGLVGGIILLTAQIIPMSKPYEVWLNWENISAYDELLHEQSARTWGTVSYDEFNPIWGERIFLDMPTEPERYVDNPFHLRVFGRDIAALNWQGLSEENITDNTLRVITDEDRAVRFRQYYFPGWQATVDGTPAEIYPDEEIGLITIDLSTGEHIVRLDYVGTPVQKLATAITWMSILIALAIWRLGKAESKTEEETLSLQTGLGLLGLIILLTVTNQIIQANDWLKLESSATEPTYMQTRLDTSFGGEITLLGYSLHNQEISASSPLNIDLYWHVPDGLEQNYRPMVQLINLNQSAAWATSSNLQPAAGEFSTFPSNRFARDPYHLRLFDATTPPFVAQIMVQVLNENGALILPDGSDRLILPERIVVNTADNGEVAKFSQAASFGTVAELWCAAAKRENGTITIALNWHFLAASEGELVVMLHGLDAEGNLVLAGDTAPFDGNFPAQFWRAGQNLLDQHSIPDEPSIEEIAIGLYTRDTIERLPVIDLQTGQALLDNQLVIRLNDSRCPR